MRERRDGLGNLYFIFPSSLLENVNSTGTLRRMSTWEHFSQECKIGCGARATVPATLVKTSYKREVKKVLFTILTRNKFNNKGIEPI